MASTANQPSAEQLFERALACMPGGSTRTTPFVPPHPPYAVSGQGCWIVDADGHEVLDLQCNYTALIHGYRRPEIVAAASEALDDGSCFGLPTAHEVALAERLGTRIPAAPNWRFTNSGTEAVMMALRLARVATGRDTVLRFKGCYHGTSDWALEPGTVGSVAALAQHVISIPGGDESALRAALGEHGDEIACVLFDAMPNRAGLRPAEPDYVRLLRDETRRRGILLVLDEVITFRLAVGGLQSFYELEPDITTLGKVIGGGFPIGAIGGSRELMALFDPREPHRISHGGTFSANPVSMRAGAAALDLLTVAEIDRINMLGDRLRTALERRRWVVTGRGSLLRVHVDDPYDLWWQLYREGLLIAANGLACISTALDDGRIDQAIDAFDRVMLAREAG